MQTTIIESNSSVIPNTEKNTTFIHKTYLKGKFAQSPNWLLHRIARKGPVLVSRSWAILAYVCSLPPETEVGIELLNENLGHTSRMLYDCLGYLEKMKHVRAIMIRDEKGRVIKAEYHFYMTRYGWNHTDNIIKLNAKTQSVEIIDNNREKNNPEKIISNENNKLDFCGSHTKTQSVEIIEDNAQNSTPSYNARDFYTNTNNNIKSSSTETLKIVAPEPVDVAAAVKFSDIIETEIKNQPTIGRDLVSRCLKNFGEKYTIDAIKYAKDKDHINPGRVFNEPSRIRYKSIDAMARVVTQTKNNLEEQKKMEDESRKMRAQTVTGFSSGAKMMREALKKKKRFR